MHDVSVFKQLKIRQVEITPQELSENRDSWLVPDTGGDRMRQGRREIARHSLPLTCPTLFVPQSQFRVEVPPARLGNHASPD